MVLVNVPRYWSSIILFGCQSVSLICDAFPRLDARFPQCLHWEDRNGIRWVEMRIDHFFIWIWRIWQHKPSLMMHLQNLGWPNPSWLHLPESRLVCIVMTYLVDCLEVADPKASKIIWKNIIPIEFISWCKSILNPAVIGVILPSKSNISPTFEAHCWRVSFSGVEWNAAGFRPLLFFARGCQCRALFRLSQCHFIPPMPATHQIRLCMECLPSSPSKWFSMVWSSESDVHLTFFVVQLVDF